MQDFLIIIFSSMQLNDTRIQEYGRNDGIQSILHCQDQFFISESNLLLLIFEYMQHVTCLEFMRWRDFFLISFVLEKNEKKCTNISNWTELKHMCFINQECDGFTLSSDLKCILHRTATALHFTGRRISQVGIRNRTSTFPKYCEEEEKLERCKNEPKCERILNCFRKRYINLIIWYDKG